MNIKSHILEGGGKLKGLKQIILKTTDLAIDKIVSKVPIDDVDIIFYDAPTNTIAHLGIGGSTNTNNLVMIAIDPDFENIKDSLESTLPVTISHELYHCLRKYSFQGQYTLLESLVNEGLADHFSMEIFNVSPQKWDEALNKEQLEELTVRAQKEYNSKDYNHRAWFFGSLEGDIPQWAGYSIGFNLVGEYLKKHPDKKPSQIWNIIAKEFSLS